MRNVIVTALVVFSVVFPVMFSAQAMFGQPLITTLAGTGPCSYSGDGGLAGQATLCSPQDAVVDFAGNIYFVDAGNWRIRKISPAGVIGTIAGNGIRGTTGDGGSALNASLGAISHLASDDSGHLCFGDLDAHKLRCVFLFGGTIQGYGTGAASSKGDGGPWTSASFNQPSGVAFVWHYQSPNAWADIYVADSVDNVVRRLDGATGIVSTVVGPGSGALGDGGPATSASLQSPSSLTYYNGVLYIADAGNHRIRKVDLNTGIITTVAGNGVPSFAGDGGPATAAQMISPGHVTFDAGGNMFLTDRGNLRVRKIDTSGIITTFAGNGDSGVGADNVPPTQTSFGGLNGVSWDQVANGLLIVDGSNRIRQVLAFQPSSTSLNVSPSAALPGDPIALVATVTPPAATGNVQFYQNSTLLGSAALSGGQATFSWTPPGTNAYPLKATYVGDAVYAASSASATEIVQFGATRTTFSSSLNPSLQAQPVTFTATVTPSAATGYVQFYGNFNSLGTAPVVNGVATFTTSSLAAGSTIVSVQYNGDAKYSGNLGPQMTQVVKFTTTASLASNSNPSSFGGPVTLTATVSPATTTGSVQFFNGTTPLGTATLTAGQAQFTHTALPVGTNSLTATYSGDANNAASTSSPIQQQVTKTSSTTTLSINPAGTTFGQPVTLTATVSPATATGSVQFFNGSTPLGTATLTAGQAQFTHTALPVGTNPLTATYSGDANNAASTSSPIQQQVTKTSSTTTLSINPAGTTFGQPVTLSATISPAASTGDVRFYQGSTLLGSAAVSNGQATLSWTASAAGSYSLQALYDGDATHNASGSLAITASVFKASANAAVNSNANPAVQGQPVTLAATISPTAATGSVLFYGVAPNSSTFTLGSAPLVNGVALFTMSSLTPGLNTIYAQYAGDTNYNPATAPGLSQAVKFSTATSLASSHNPSTFGQAVKLTATVAPSNATGVVQFFLGSALLGSAPLTGGQAQLTIAALPAGTDSLMAVYTGDANDAASVSSPMLQTVHKANSTARLTASSAFSRAGQNITFTATLTPATATGTVHFLDGGSQLGTAPLINGVAVFSTSNLEFGFHSIEASYAGDGNVNSSQSSTLSHAVGH